jgi:dTMP kinase
MPDERSTQPGKPFFIVLEGGEGSGKTTQAKALAGRVRRTGFSCVLTRDPGGTAIGKQIEEWLKQSSSISAPSELLLFAAARSLLTNGVILPALKTGAIVISDRYSPSSIAYQAYGRGLDIATVRATDSLATGGLVPDLIILLDLPAEQGLKRKDRNASDRFHEQDMEFHQRVREAYLEMARTAPAQWVVIDARLPRPPIQAIIWDKIAQLLDEPIK